MWIQRELVLNKQYYGRLPLAVPPIRSAQSHWTTISMNKKGPKKDHMVDENRKNPPGAINRRKFTMKARSIVRFDTI